MRKEALKSTSFIKRNYITSFSGLLSLKSSKEKLEPYFSKNKKTNSNWKKCNFIPTQKSKKSFKTVKTAVKNNSKSSKVNLTTSKRIWRKESKESELTAVLSKEPNTQLHLSPIHLLISSLLMTPATFKFVFQISLMSPIPIPLVRKSHQKSWLFESFHLD